MKQTVYGLLDNPSQGQPPTGCTFLYTKGDNKLYLKNDANVEFELGKLVVLSAGDSSVTVGGTPYAPSIIVNNTPALQTTGDDVVVSEAAPPTAGQALIASSATQAVWSDLPDGGTPSVAFSAYVTANYDTPEIVPNVVLFGSIEFDTHSVFTLNKRWTPPIAGWYYVGSQVWSTQYAGKIIYIAKNGTAIKRISKFDSLNKGGDHSAGLVYLNGTTDYVEVYFTGDGSGFPITVEGGVDNSHFYGFLVKAT